MASLRRFEGVMITDHRAGPGVPGFYQPGMLVEEVTLSCVHCSGCWIANPDRERDRHYCPKCDRYICDGCALAATLPDYVHRSLHEVVDLVRSGKFTLQGSLCNPILVSNS